MFTGQPVAMQPPQVIEPNGVGFPQNRWSLSPTVPFLPTWNSIPSLMPGVVPATVFAQQLQHAPGGTACFGCQSPGELVLGIRVPWHASLANRHKLIYVLRLLVNQCLLLKQAGSLLAGLLGVPRWITDAEHCYDLFWENRFHILQLAAGAGGELNSKELQDLMQELAEILGSEMPTGHWPERAREVERIRKVLEKLESGAAQGKW